MLLCTLAIIFRATGIAARQRRAWLVSYVRGRARGGRLAAQSPGRWRGRAGPRVCRQCYHYCVGVYYSSRAARRKETGCSRIFCDRFRHTRREALERGSIVRSAARRGCQRRGLYRAKTNLAQCCKDNRLHQVKMRQLINGSVTRYRGWTWQECNINGEQI